MSNTIRLASLSTYSSVDGPGLRTVVWFQGCTHNCPACHNPQTHDLNGGYEVEVEDLLNQIRALNNNKITISGGEPFLQNEALLVLTQTLKKEGYTIWLYTGFAFETLLEDSINQVILEQLEVLVDGKYIQELRDVNAHFKGSSNQRLINMMMYYKHKNVEEAIIRWNFVD